MKNYFSLIVAVALTANSTMASLVLGQGSWLERAIVYNFRDGSIEVRFGAPEMYLNGRLVERKTRMSLGDILEGQMTAEDDGKHPTLYPEWIRYKLITIEKKPKAAVFQEEYYTLPLLIGRKIITASPAQLKGKTLLRVPVEKLEKTELRILESNGLLVTPYYYLGCRGGPDSRPVFWVPQMQRFYIEAKP